MLGQSSDFSIAITADDEVSPVLRAINQSITQFRRSVAENTAGFNDTGEAVRGIGGATQRLENLFKRGPLAPFRRELKELRSGAVEAAEAIGKIFTPLSALTAATSVAGAGAAMNAFARRGAGVGLTSQQLAMNPRDLQRLSGAADLANAPAGAAVSAMTGLNASMRGAAFMGDAEMLGVFKQLGLGDKLLNPDGSLVSPTEMFHRLLPELAKIRDPRARMAAEQKLGIADLDALIAKGPEGVRGLEDEAGRHFGLSDEDIKKAEALHKAFTALEQSVTGFSDKLAALASGPMQQALTGMSSWLDKAKEVPEVMKAAEVGVGLLATVIGLTLVAAVGKFLQAVIAANTSLLATPLGRMLLAGYAGYEAVTGGPGSPGRAGNAFDQGDWSKWLDLRYLGRRIFGGANEGHSLPGGGYEAPIPPAPGAGPDEGDSRARPPPSPSSRGGGVSPMSGEADPSLQRGIDFFVKKGLTREQAAGVVARLAAESGGGTRLDPNAVNPSSGAYGIAQWLGGRKPAALAAQGDLDRQLELVWREFQTSENSAFAQIRGTRSAADAARAMESFERAGNPTFTEQAATAAERLLSRVGPVSPAAAAEVPKSPPGSYLPLPAAMQPEAHPLINGFLVPPGTKFNSGGQPYAADLDTMSAQEKANVEASMRAIKNNPHWADRPAEAPPVASPPNPAPADNQIHGHLQIDFNNAPVGMRSRIKEFAGPLDATVRTVHATGLA